MSLNQVQIQIGIETKSIPLRMTPIDYVISGIQQAATDLIGLLVLALDAKDVQPNDGEIDVKLGDSLTRELRKLNPVIDNLLRFAPSDAVLFIRVKRVNK